MRPRAALGATPSEITTAETGEEEGSRRGTKEEVQVESDYDETLFLRLRQLRKVVADLDRVPPFVVFHDRTLKEMATSYPETGVALLQIYGVSEAKLKRYGRRFLDAIDKHCTEHGIGPEQRSG